MNKDWIEVELGNVCDFVGGGTPSKSNPSFWGGTIPWASIKDIKGSYLSRTEDFISEEGLKNSASNLANENDIILATRINPGRSIVSKIQVAINQDLKIAKPLLKFAPRFLFYLFKEIEPKIVKLSSGTTVLGINLTNLKNINVPIPPFPEQRAIVARIEELFSELDHSVSNLQAAQAKLEIYRQAVLKKAFEGGLGDKVALESVIQIVSGNTPKGINDQVSSGNVPFFKVSDMNLIGNEIEMIESKLLIDETILKTLKIKLFPKGTVIFPKRGGSILTNKKRVLKCESAFDLNLMGVVPNEKILSKFLYYFFLSIDLGKICDGSAVPQINYKNIAPLRFPFCSLENQKVMIQEIESRLSVADKMAETIQTSLQKAEALRQSILKKAFEGKLLSEAEVEACRKESDWEPAERLLARIERSRNERIKSEKSKNMR